MLDEQQRRQDHHNYEQSNRNENVQTQTCGLVVFSLHVVTDKQIQWWFLEKLNSQETVQSRIWRVTDGFNF